MMRRYAVRIATILCLVVLVSAVPAGCLAGPRLDVPAPQTGLEGFARNSTAVRSVVVDILVDIIIVVFIISVIREMTTRAFFIDPIAVPAELTAAGYTPQVLAERIRTEIRALQRAATIRSGVEEGFELSATLVDFTVPTAGVSFRNTIQYLRQVLKLPDEHITGEVVRQVVAEDKPRLRMTLRTRNGSTASAEIAGTSEMQIDEWVKNAAYELVVVADPYLLASYWLSREQAERKFDKTIEMVELCLRATAATKHHAAYIIWGNALAFERKFEAAEAKYRTAASLKKSRAVFVSWGNVLRQMRKIDAAAAMYWRALEIDVRDSVAWSNLGNVRTDQHRYRAAIRCYSNAVKRNPQFANAWRGWGAALTKLNRYEEAEDRLRRALDIDPSLGWAHISLAQLRRAQRRFDEALEAIKPATKLRTVAADAFVVWGDILADKEEFEDAERKYEEAERLNPAIGIGDFGSALRLSRAHRYDESAAAARRSLARNRYHMGAWFRLANALEQSEHGDDAIGVCRQLLEVDSYQWVTSLTVVGRVLKSRHHYRAAIASFRRAAADVAESWPLREWGETLVAMRKPAEAVAIYRRCLKVHPDDFRAMAGEARALWALGRFTRALRLARQASRIDPGNGYTLWILSETLSRMGRREEAASELKGIVDEHPMNAPRIYEYGRTLSMLPKRREDARRAFNDVLALNPRFVDALLQLAMMARDDGRLDDAVVHAARAVTIEPWNGWPRRVVGELLLKSRATDASWRWFAACHARAPHDIDILLAWGDALQKSRLWNEAIEKYEDAAERDPYDSRAEVKIGDTLRAQRRPKEAIPHYRRAARIDPSNAGAWVGWGNALMGMRRYDRAEALARRALGVADVASLYILRSKSLRSMGRVDEALSSAGEACAADRYDRSARRERIECLIGVGRIKDALAEAIAAIDDFAEDWQFQIDAAHLLKRLGDRKRAMEMLDAVLRSHAPNAIRLHEYGRALSMLPNRREDARRAFNEALALNPRFVDAFLGLAFIARDDGRFHEAVAHAVRAVTIEPWNSWPRRVVGEFLVKSRASDAAWRWFAACHARAPHDIDILLTWGDALHNSRLWNEAIEKYEDAAERDPYDSRAEVKIGNTLRALRRPKEAIRHYSRAARIDPSNAGAWVDWGNALLGMRRYDRAEALSRRALGVAHGSSLYILRSKSLRSMGRIEEALSSAAEACAADLYDRSARRERFECLITLGRIDDALAETMAAIDDFADDWQFQIDAADRLKRLGDRKGAVAILNAVLRAHPRDARAIIDLAALLANARDLDGADALLRNALEIEPENERGLREVASVMRGRKNKDAAEAWLAEARRKHPDSTSILLDSASLFADAARLALNDGGEFSTDVRTASGFFSSAIDMDPWNSDPLTNWGELLLDTGDAAGALDRFDRALRINKWDWIAWTGRARALHSLGRTKRARASLARAQAIRPHDRYVLKTATLLS